MKNITRDNLSDTVKNSFAHINDERQRLLVSRLVHHLHASHLLGLLKPDEAIYRAFERASGFDGTDGRPEEILFFDDLEENVEAARACGWSSVRVDHTGDPAEQMRRELRERGLGV